MELLSPEVFIPLKINTRKGRRANVLKPDETYSITPLSKLYHRFDITVGRFCRKAYHKLRRMLK